MMYNMTILTKNIFLIIFGSKLTPDVNRSGENRQKCQKKNFFFHLQHPISLRKMGCKRDQMIGPFFDSLRSIPSVRSLKQWKLKNFNKLKYKPGQNQQHIT